MESYKLKRKYADSESWQHNMYTMCAVQTAVANVLLGQKSKAHYIKEPLLQHVEQKEKNKEQLSEEEKKKQRDKLLATLQIMQANFELNHSNEEGRQD